MCPLSHMSLFADLSISQLPPCCVLYVIVVAFWKNRQFQYGAVGWYELFGHGELRCGDEIIISKYYQRQPAYARLVVLFLLVCWMFEVAQTELVRCVSKNQRGFWQRVLPLPTRILHTVSEFVGTRGQHVSTADISRCFEELVLQICAIVAVERLCDEDLCASCRHVTLCSASGGNEALPSRSTGVRYCANLIVSLGMGAALSVYHKAEEQEEQQQHKTRMLTGFGSSSPQLVCAILRTPGAKNITQLATPLRNRPDESSALRPSAQVLRHGVCQLDKDKVVLFYERFVTHVRRVKGFGKIVVSLDATLLDVFATYDDAEWLYDHDQHTFVRGNLEIRRLSARFYCRRNSG